MIDAVSSKPARKKRILVAITGASGAIYGQRLLMLLRKMDVESHLIISQAAHLTIAHELQVKPQAIKEMADHCHAVQDLAAVCSSGSFAMDGMIIAPCSAKSMAEIAHGITSNLISRAAEVTLKERRRLVLIFRETPLLLSHIRNMEAVTEMGGIICPAVPAFYNHPTSLEAMVDYGLGRVLDLFGLVVPDMNRWGG